MKNLPNLFTRHKKHPGIICLLCLLLLLTGCSQNTGAQTGSPDTRDTASQTANSHDPQSQPSDTADSQAQTAQSQDTAEPSTTDASGRETGGSESDSATARVEILKITDDELLVCGLDSFPGLCFVSTGGKLETSDGQTMAFDDLATGMIVDLTWNGSVQETYPAKFSYDNLKDTVERGSVTMKLYKRLIQALAEVDPALNADISQCYFDFTKVSSLSDGEKEGLAYICGSYFDAWGSQATSDELAAEGILDPLKGLEDGILVTIEELSVDGNTVRCNAQKYRSGTGAYYFNDMTAEYKDGEYTYNIGSEAIS